MNEMNPILHTIRQGDTLYNTSLANDEIAPNEERSVTLILTKTMKM